MSGITGNIRSFEGFWALTALITLIAGLLVAIFGFIFLDFDQVVGVAAVLVLFAIACTLQAIYYQRKARESEKGS